MVNTFVLHPDLQVNASLLDDTRLGKQRIEAHQILDVLEGRKNGWQNHPAVNMWRGYEKFLKLYINFIIEEWVRRGFKNSCSTFIIIGTVLQPWWWDITAIHFTHQANLFLKMPQHYSQINITPSIFDDEQTFNYYTKIGYIWPEKLEYEQKMKLLAGIIHPHEIAERLTPNLVNPRYCPAVMSYGKKAGQTCFRILKKDAHYCGLHSK